MNEKRAWSDSECWSRLSLSTVAETIPAVNFTEAAPGVKKLLSSRIKIYVTPETVGTKFCDTVKEIRLLHSTVAESKQWLDRRAKHEILYSTTQLCCFLCDAGLWNFSQNCWQRSSSDLLPQIRKFHQFHLYFMVRWILYHMEGGIISENKCFAGRSTIQSIQQSLWWEIRQQNL